MNLLIGMDISFMNIYKPIKKIVLATIKKTKRLFGVLIIIFITNYFKIIWTNCLIMDCNQKPNNSQKLAMPFQLHKLAQ